MISHFWLYYSHFIFVVVRFQIEWLNDLINTILWFNRNGSLCEDNFNENQMIPHSKINTKNGCSFFRWNYFSFSPRSIEFFDKKKRRSVTLDVMFLNCHNDTVIYCVVVILLCLHQVFGIVTGMPHAKHSPLKSIDEMQLILLQTHTHLHQIANHRYFIIQILKIIKWHTRLICPLIWFLASSKLGTHFQCLHILQILHIQRDLHDQNGGKWKQAKHSSFWL